MTNTATSTRSVVTLSTPEAPLTQDIFAATLDVYLHDLSGMVGLAVHDFGTGNDFIWNATEIFPTASTLKVPLLYTLYRLADAGTIDLSERIALSYANRVPGSGVLQHMDEGLRPTLRDLAELMIIVSDNWATDLLWQRMTKATVDTMLIEIGMTQTSLPMTIFELFAMLSGVDPATTDYDTLREAMEQEDPQPDNPALAFDARNDTSSPADMVHLLKLIDRGEGLTAQSREAILTIMKHQNFTSIIPHRLPENEEIETANKTGSLSGAKNDVGLVYSPKAHYAIAFMSRSQDDIPEVVDRMSRMSRWVYDALAGSATQ